MMAINQLGHDAISQLERQQSGTSLRAQGRDLRGQGRVMFQYDISYNPPAPTAKVTFARANAGPDVARVEAQMLIDTGADISLIPRTVVDAINPTPTGRTMEVMSFDGHKSARPIVAASMHLGKYIDLGTQNLLDELSRRGSA